MRKKNILCLLILAIAFLFSASAYAQALFYQSSIVYDSANDRYFVVYDKGGTESNIYGEFLDRDGNNIKPEFIIRQVGEALINPSVAYNSTDGTFLVAWEDISNRNIYAKIVDEDGSNAAITISDAAYYQITPSIAYDKFDNRYLVVWEDCRTPGYSLCVPNTNTNCDIYGQLVNADGNRPGINFLISRSSWGYDENCQGRRKHPAVSFDNANKKFLVVWYDKRTTESYSYKAYIYGRILDKDGGLIGTTDFQISENSLDALSKPKVAVDDINHKFLVVWDETSSPSGSLEFQGIKGQFVNATDIHHWLDNFEISDQKIFTQGLPSLAYDFKNQRFLVIWRDNRDSTERNNDIYGQFVNSDGNFLITDLDSSETTPLHALSVAYNPDSCNFLVAYSYGATEDMQFSLVDSPCEETVAPTVLSTNPVSGAQGVAVNAAIRATFSEAMLNYTIDKDTFKLNDGAVAGAVSYIYDPITKTGTAIFDPSADLAYNTTYTATITTGVEDMVGNNMESDYTWSFTTAILTDIEKGGEGEGEGGGGTGGEGAEEFDWGAGCSLIRP